MIKRIVMLVLVCSFGFAVEVSDRLVDALCMVESGGKVNAVGDNGKAVGVLQLHKCYVSEVNRICTLSKKNLKYSFEDRANPAKSKEMTKIYLEFWGRIYERQTGKTATNEVLAKIHNGHNYWKKSDAVKGKVQKYWKKVERTLDREKH